MESGDSRFIQCSFSQSDIQSARQSSHLSISSVTRASSIGAKKSFIILEVLSASARQTSLLSAILHTSFISGCNGEPRLVLSCQEITNRACSPKVTAESAEGSRKKKKERSQLLSHGGGAIILQGSRAGDLSARVKEVKSELTWSLSLSVVLKESSDYTNKNILTIINCPFIMTFLCLLNQVFFRFLMQVLFFL